MKKLAMIVYLIISGFLFAQVNEIQGFGKAKWGMSVEEVMQLENTSLIDKKVFAKTEAKLEKIQTISNIEFRIWYSFNDNKLDNISLSPKGYNIEDYDKYSEIYNTILQNINSKYGITQNNTTQYGAVKVITNIWEIGETTITIKFTHTEFYNSLGLSYTKKKVSEF